MLIKETKFKKGQEVILIDCPIKKHIGSRASILKVVPVLNDEDRMNYIGYSAMYNDKTKYTTAFYKMIVGNIIIPKYADDFCLKEINDYGNEV